MLQRKPTRIELKAEDKEEVGVLRQLSHLPLDRMGCFPFLPQYEAIKREQAEAKRRAGLDPGNHAFSPLFSVRRRHPPATCDTAVHTWDLPQGEALLVHHAAVAYLPCRPKSPLQRSALACTNDHRRGKRRRPSSTHRSR